jgi:hypothetical protein
VIDAVASEAPSEELPRNANSSKETLLLQDLVSQPEESRNKEMPFMADVKDALKSIHSADDLEALEKYLGNQTLYDAVELSQVMPRTASALYNGRVSPREVLKELLYIQWVSHRNSKMANRVKLSYEELCLELSKALARLALPDRFMQFGHRHVDVTSKVVESFEHVREHFANVLKEAFDNAEFARGGYFLMDKLKLAVEQHCVAWAARLDKALFWSKKGTFLRLCPIYNKSEKEFEEKVKHLMPDIILRFSKMKQKESHAKLAEVVQGLLEGLHVPSDKICWECGQEMKDEWTLPLVSCDGCSVAKYCGAECKDKAWSTGHEMACSTLERENHFFQQFMAVVDTVHKDSGKMDGIPLNPAFDYFTVSQCLEILSQKLQDGNVKELPWLSMVSYYASLAATLRGEWWLYKEPIETAESADFETAYAQTLVGLCSTSDPRHDKMLPGNSPSAVSQSEFAEHYVGNIPPISIENEKNRLAAARQEHCRHAALFRTYHHKVSTEPDIPEDEDDDELESNGTVDLLDEVEGLRITEFNSADNCNVVDLNDIDD